MAQQEPQDPPLGFNRVALPDLLPLGYPFPVMLSASPEGLILMRGFNDQAGGAGFEAYLLVSEGNVSELFRRGEELLDVDGVSLGFLHRAEAQFLGDGSIVLSANLRPTADSSQLVPRLLRLDIDVGLRELPISSSEQLFDLIQDPGSGTMRASQASVSQRFVVRRVSDDRFFVTDGDTLLREIDTFGRSSSSFPESFRAVLHAHSDLVLIQVNAYTAVAQNANGFVTHERIDWRYEIDGPDAPTRVVASGQYEREFTPGAFGASVVTASRGVAPANALLGGNNEGGGTFINSRGQVVIGLRRPAEPGGNFFPGFNPPSWQRIDPDGTATTLTEVREFSFFRAYGILENGGVLAEASAAGAPQTIRVFFPGRTQVLLSEGDVIGDTACQFASAPAVAGPNVLLRCFLEAPQGHIRHALAIPGDSPVLRWTADFGGDWGDAENWDPARVPGQGDETFFDIDSSYELRVGSRQSGRSRIEAGSVSLLETDLELLGSMRVGGGGTLTLHGGRLQSGGMIIGHLPPEQPEEPRLSAVDVDNRGTLDVKDRLTVGAADEGFLRISNSDSSITELVVGSGAPGLVSLIGPGPGAADENDPLNLIQALKLGDGAAAEMFVLSGASVLSGSVVIGGGTESASLRPATLELRGVTGEGQGGRRTRWEVFPDRLFALGGHQPGVLTLSDGALLLIDGPLVMGQARIPGAVQEGFLTVFGRSGDSAPPSRLIARQLEMSLAEGVNTGVDIGAGARVTLGGDDFSGVLRMARAPGTEGYLRVEGASNGSPSTLEVIESKDLGLVQINPCIIGEKGVGIVDVLDGGRFHCDGTLLMGSESGSLGNVRVAGRSGTTPSTLSAAQICIGRAGECASEEGIQSGRNVLIVEDGGLVEAEKLALASGSIIRGNGRIDVKHSLIEGEVYPGWGFVMGPAASMPGEVVRLERMNLTPEVTRVNRHSENGRALPGTLTFEGDVTFGMSALLLIDIEGPDAEQQDGLVVTGRLEIEEGARLAVHFGNSHVPREGDVLSFITTGEGITGAFSEVRIFGLAPGFEYELDTAGGEVRLTALNDAVVAGSPRFAPLPSLSSEGIRLSIEAPADLETVLLASPDLQLPFAPIHTNQGSFLYVDPIEPGQGQRLYRAIGR